MARLARIVIPQIPHHVTQRGNRRQRVFFQDDDYRSYLGLLAEYCVKANVKVWAWCLMPNHVHLILVPSHEDGLRVALSEAHRRYSREINFREGWRGFLWQGRFASCPMDERHLMAAARYVELNPVRAGLVTVAQDWPWSSARAHLDQSPDGLTDIRALGDLVDDWVGFLQEGIEAPMLEILRAGERTGRPLGDDDFVKELEARTGRELLRRRAGRKKKLI